MSAGKVLVNWIWGVGAGVVVVYLPEAGGCANEACSVEQVIGAAPGRSSGHSQWRGVEAGMARFEAVGGNGEVSKYLGGPQ